jgi:kumamolisin
VPKKSAPKAKGGKSRPAPPPIVHEGIHPYIKYKASAGRMKPLAAESGWSIPDLCQAYDWPTGLEGGGVIAIVELGGGWLASDVDTFFASIGQPSPSITDVSVDGTQNTPDPDPRGADGEVALDIQVAAAAYYVATGQPAQIRMYWAKDIAAGVRAATADGCDVCSISWGADEATWGTQLAMDMEAAATEATTAGMVVFAAAGDNDSADGGPTPANVDVPAACPHVVGCGGTNKTRSTETVWNNDPGNPSGSGTGGGFSRFFKPMPGWQHGAPHGSGRMVPDVAANADPNTGYRILVQGEEKVVGGTSAVAPLYAGLFAAFGRKLGFITPTLWENQTAFTDITQGDNGKYRAGVGPDPCTGLGVPIGSRLAALFAAGSTQGLSTHVKALIAENHRLREQLATRA